MKAAGAAGSALLVVLLVCCCFFLDNAQVGEALLMGRRGASATDCAAAAGGGGGGGGEEWRWKCAEFAPPECALETTRGNMQIMNRTLYFEITVPTNYAATLTPIVLMHGGPGGTHFGMRPLRNFACGDGVHGRPIVAYDQMGSGLSEHVPDIAHTAPELLTVQYFVTELHALLDHLALRKVHLLGHSWGGMLAQSYAIAYAKTEPGRIASLLLVSSLASSERFTSTIRSQLVSKMLTVYQEAITDALRPPYNFTAPKYLAAVDYMSQLVFPLQPRPDCDMEGSGLFSADIYNGMWGPCEFICTGTLASWDVRSSLSLLTMPTLILRGENDEVTLEIAEEMQTLIKGSELYTVPHAGHSPYMEEWGAFYTRLTYFLAPLG